MSIVPARRWPRVVLAVLAGIILLAALLVYLAPRLGLLVCPRPAPSFEPAAYSPLPATFSGDSGQLKDTVIVPALDTPMPQGKNVIWCASFQMAWGRLRDDVIKAPLSIRGAEDVAARLNAAKISESDLPAGAWFAMAGRCQDGIVEKVRQGLAAKFPDLPPPALDDVDPRGGLAYAYLRAAVKFTTPYFDHERGLTFTDSAGRKTKIATCGFYECSGEATVNEFLAEQISVLFCEGGENPESFALDLCRTSAPSQIILARIEPQASLAETLAELQRRIKPGADGPMSLDVLELPNLAWRIDHHFSELEGPGRILNDGNYISRAAQTIEFRLDKSGAVVASSAEIYVTPAPREFLFDRPFLIVMQKRGSAQPFFVMWVDNAELLAPLRPSSSR